ncbi:MAG: SRPBCC family protein [Mycobacteriales bacterium]
MSRWVETVERVIPAPAERIFELVADPRRHMDIDGSGTVHEATEVPERLSLGATFGMNMHFGGPYTMTSTIVEFEEGRRIAWQSRPPAGSARWRRLFGGRIWRYELEPVETGTRVRESWDLTEERLRTLVLGYRRKTRANMQATLQRIERLVAPGG